VRVGVIGLGFGKRHLREYLRLQSVEVTAVCDLNEDTFDDPLILRCGARTYRDAEEMLSKEELNAVSICTPPGTHKPLTILAAQQGIHVLCEKPMAASLEDCDEMIRACERHGVKLMIGFKKRFAPAYVELEHLIRSKLGPPFSIFYRYVCYGGVEKEWFWRDGGPIVENTAHATDILRFLAGDVRRVYAEGDNFLSHDRDEIDTAVFTLRFRNGCIGAVRAGCWARGKLKREHLIAYFSRTTVEIEGPFDSPCHLRVWRDEIGALEEFRFEDAEGISGEIEHFVECVMDDKPPRVTGEDGRAALAICLAVKESARTNRPVYF
jgi:predicted dehydrogenase